MAVIINIDTSSKYCSVALAINGEVVFGMESSEEMDHSVSLAPFVDKAIKYLREKDKKLDAVSVINGPGSYTGLRIGFSLAKGLAFSLDLPLITLSSLEVMAVRAMFSYPEFQGNETIVSMMDAGRMEVYAGTYDHTLNLRGKEKPEILTEDSFSDLVKEKKVIFVGDGTSKFKSLYKNENAVWLGNLMPHAKYMTALSEKYYRENKFSDLAYVTPRYLKEYMVTQSKSKL